MCNKCNNYKKNEKYNFCPICGEKFKRNVFVTDYEVKKLSNNYGHSRVFESVLK